MNATVHAQRERALGEARRRVTEAEMLTWAWSRWLETFVGAIDLNDRTASVVAGELADYARERGADATRRLRTARTDVDRILAAMSAATRSQRAETDGKGNTNETIDPATAGAAAVDRVHTDTT